MERGIEVGNETVPKQFTRGNLIKTLLHLGCKTIIHYTLEMILQIIIYKHTYVCRKEFALLRAGILRKNLAGYIPAGKSKPLILALRTRSILLHNISPLHNGSNRRGISRWPSYAKLLQLLNKRGLAIPWRTLRKMLCCSNLQSIHTLTLRKLRQQLDICLLLVIVPTLHIDLKKTVKEHILPLRYKLLRQSGGTYHNLCLLYGGICHLRGHGARPDKIIEPLLLSRTLYCPVCRIGWPYSLVRLLRALGLCLVLTGFGVLLTVILYNGLLYRGKSKLGEISGIGTHIGNESLLIQCLRNPHSLGDREAQLPCRLLLQGRGGEWRSRSAGDGMLLYGLNPEICTLAALQQI